MNADVRVVACGPTHLHVLCSKTEADAKKQIGKAKQFASLKFAHPRKQGGKLWAQGCHIVQVNSSAHEDHLFEYLCDHAVKDDAWVWRVDRAPGMNHPE